MFITSSVAAQGVVRDKIEKSDQGRIEFSLHEDPDHDLTSLPIVLFKGALPGPVFTIIAGIHGYEYPPIVALQELMAEIDMKRLKGTVVCVPIANLASFYTRTPFLNPTDRKNLNNAFPGKEHGTATERLAYLITHEIIANSDVLVDVHGGDASEDLLPFICYYDNTDAPDKTARAKKLCEASGFENIVSYPYNLTPDQPALYAFKQAVQDGKVALSIESGKLGNVQPESVAEIKSALYRMMSSLGMLPDFVKPMNISHHTYNQQQYVRSENRGIFYSNYSAGDYVTKGDVIGYISDIFGKRVDDVVAPVSGLILYKIGTPPVSKGDTICCIVYEE